MVQRALEHVVPAAEAHELGTPRDGPCAAPPKAAPAPEPERPGRVYSKTRFVWIRERPDWNSQWLGYLWFGGSVRLKTGKPVYALGCEVWYEVEPRGFVCVDERRATLNGDDPQYRMVASRAPDFSMASPHRYAESLGSPRYATLPTPADVHDREPDLAAYLRVLDAVSRGTFDNPIFTGADRAPAEVPAESLPGLPADLQVQRWTWPRRSTIAHLGAFEHDSRAFLLTADLTWIPRERTRPYAPLTFRGVRLDGSVHLPIAFFREHDRRGYARSAAGRFSARAGFAFPRLSWVPLTGRREKVDGIRYLETALDGTWVRAIDAVVPVPSATTPWGAAVGGPDPSRRDGRATWIETSIEGGWLIAYEDTYPVYVTLSAAGRNGATKEGSQGDASTPVGRFTISGKFLTATMDGPTGVSHADVPWVQNFTGPYAIHAAYWHDAWGERVSGGCVNVSPEDGKWLFSYSEPELPEGWHGVRWAPEREPTTAVIVRE